MEIKTARVTALLPQAFAEAREMNPAQALTNGVYELDTSAEESALEPIERIQLHESDIKTFHNYSWPESFQAEIAWLRRFHRPVICSKSMARSVGSTFDGILPIANQERVGASNWGFVAGKTQNLLSLGVLATPLYSRPAAGMFHEVLRPDGTLYRQAEVDFIRQPARKQ
jgi:hypothetical protein